VEKALRHVQLAFEVRDLMNRYYTYLTDISMIIRHANNI